MAVGDSYQVPLSDLSMEKTVRDRNSRTSQALRELIGEAGTGGSTGGGGGSTVDTLGGATVTGRAVMKAADATAVRTLIGAATPAQITAAVNGLIAAAPGALDTLDELAAALGDDPNFASTITGLIGAKYTKPGTGIPKADLVAAVQASLGLADSASQPGHKHAASDMTATGTRDATTFLRGDNTWATPAGGGGEANVELAYAETSSKVPMNTSDAYADAAGLAITFATTGRPAMVTANLGTLYGSDNATWGLAVVRVSDGAVMAEGVANSSPAVGYPPPPVLQFRVPANTASNTYRVQTKRWEGGATGEINSQERGAFIQAVAV